MCEHATVLSSIRISDVKRLVPRRIIKSELFVGILLIVIGSGFGYTNAQTIDADIHTETGNAINQSVLDDHWPLEHTYSKADNDVESVTYSPDGEYIVYGSSDDTVYIHSAENSELVETLTEEGVGFESVAFSADGDYLAAGNSDGLAHIYTVDDWELQQTLSEAEEGVSSVAFSPEGDYFAYGSLDAEVYVHTTEDWEHQHTLTESAFDVWDVEYSPGGEYIAYSNRHGRGFVYVHNTENGELVEELSVSGSSSHNLEFSPDGELLAYACDDGYVYIHNTDDWEVEHQLSEAGEGIGGRPRGVAFTPDGRHIAYGSHEENVYVHNAESGELLQTLTESEDRVLSVAISPGGNQIAYGSRDEHVYVHEVTVTSSKPDKQIVDDFRLYENYPNPFNPVTTIRYELPEHTGVTLEVFDITGRKVSTLVDETQRAGLHEVDFNAAQLSSGSFIYRLEAGDYVSTRQMLLIK